MERSIAYHRFLVRANLGKVIFSSGLVKISRMTADDLLAADARGSGDESYETAREGNRNSRKKGKSRAEKKAVRALVDIPLTIFATLLRDTPWNLVALSLKGE